MSNTIKLLESIKNNLNEAKKDELEYYYLFDETTGYLLSFHIDRDDGNLRCFENANTIEEAKRYKDEYTADKNTRPGYREDTTVNDKWWSNDKIVVVTLQQLLSGEIETKTDLSSLTNSKSNIKSNKDDEDEESNEIKYIFTCEDGTTFTDEKEYSGNLDLEPEPEDLPSFNKAVEYCKKNKLSYFTLSDDKGHDDVDYVEDEYGNWVQTTR